tara:strand:+ start:920 stop:1252 length:333 start_codon:yes stop_codon:yes gene_type:complete
MKKQLLLFLFLTTGCSILIDVEFPKKNIKKCEKACKAYEIFEDNSFTSSESDSLWVIYKNRKTEDPYCVCLRLCMDSDLICGTADLETKEFAYPTIGDPKAYLKTQPEEN